MRGKRLYKQMSSRYTAEWPVRAQTQRMNNVHLDHEQRSTMSNVDLHNRRVLLGCTGRGYADRKFTLRKGSAAGRETGASGSPGSGAARNPNSGLESDDDAAEEGDLTVFE